MVYSNCVLRCIFTFYALEVLHVVADHNSKHKVDEFIDKLLVSEKLDKLAEKIAEKAVEKILYLQPNLRITEGSIDDKLQKREDNRQKDELRKSALQNDNEKQTAKNISFNEASLNLENTSTPMKNLSLKYKHFTKGPAYSKNSVEYDDTNTKKRDETSSDISTDLQAKSQSNESKVKPNTNSNQNKIAKKTNAQQIREKTQDENNDTHDYSNEKDGSLSIENKKNILEILIDSNSEDHRSNEDVHENGKQSDFDRNLMKDRDLFEKDQHTSKGTKSKSRRKRRYHKEGKRLYTFLSSSDYDEYHQELDKVEKERTVFI